MIDVSFNLQEKTRNRKSYPKIMRCGDLIAIMEREHYGMVIASSQSHEIGVMTNFGKGLTWQDFDKEIIITNRR